MSCKSRCIRELTATGEIRRILLIFAFILFGVLGTTSIQAQCGFGGTQYGNNITPTVAGQTVTLNNFIWGGEQYTLNATGGCTYTISMCGTSWDTQITVFDAGQNVIAFNDDSCGLQSQVTFTAASTGPITVQINQFFCATNFTGAEYFGVTLDSCSGIGCTNPAACNYNPSATTDDGSCCFTGCVDVTAGGGTFDNEISWAIFNNLGVQVASGIANFPGGINFCLPDDCYTVELYDSYGDGWNGANMVIDVDGVNVVNTTMPTGSFAEADFSVGSFISGCTDPSAANYDPTATCDDGSCLDCFDPQTSGCPDIDLGPDIVMPTCFDPCVPTPITADVFETGATTSYEVCGINFSPPYPFNAGTPIFIGLDDIFSPAIGLPFNFCFFGQTYNQVVVGANGLITFDLANADRCCAWAYGSTIPTPSLPYGDTPPVCGGSGQDGIYNASINGAYHDMDPSIGGNIYYAIQGSYPCRVFIVNWDNVAHFSCTSIATTQQIVIYETTNVIEVYIDNKPLCASWNGGNAVVGIQNQTGTVGYTPNSRQTGQWTASNEAWRFTPNGAPNFQVEWYDEGGTNVGSGLSLDVCPSETPQTFDATATYTMCNGSTIEVSDDVIISCALVLLSVDWLRFDAELSPDERKVFCSWSTGSETDNDFFTLMRSKDSNEWEEIGIVDGAGTTTEPRHYSYTDPDPLPGKSYYRVMQTDFNGQSSFSEIRAVERSIDDKWVIYPNPGNGVFSVNSAVTKYKLRILDARGREVKYTQLPTGEYSISNAESGYYTIEFSAVGGGVLKRLPLVVEE